MTRKSVDARAAHAADVPQPPPSLKGEARKTWQRIVAAHAADFFRDGNLQLLEMYCRTLVQLDRAMTEVEGMSIAADPKAYAEATTTVTKLNLACIQLATKLRLTIQSALRGESGKLKERGPGAIDDNLLGGNVTALRRA